MTDEQKNYVDPDDASVDEVEEVDPEEVDEDEDEDDDEAESDADSGDVTDSQR